MFKNTDKNFTTQVQTILKISQIKTSRTENHNN